MDKFTFGQYYPGHSLIYQLGPASKLLINLALLLVILLVDNLTSCLGPLVLLLLALKASKVPWLVFYHDVKPLMIIALVTVFFQLLFEQGGKVIWQFGLFRITQWGISSSLVILARFSLIIIASALLTLSTSPIEIANGLRSLLRPLQAFRVPVDDLSLMISISLRFIPILAQELTTIEKAQKSRGVDFQSGSWVARIKKMALLLMPLLFKSFERAQTLSDAMVARGYQNGINRVAFGNHFRWQDGLAWLLFLVSAFFTIINRG